MHFPMILTFKQPRRTPFLRSPMPSSYCPQFTIPLLVSTATLGSTRPILEAFYLARWVPACWRRLACGVSCSALVATLARGQGQTRGPVDSHSKTGRRTRGKARTCKVTIWRPSRNLTCFTASQALKGSAFLYTTFLYAKNPCQTKRPHLLAEVWFLNACRAKGNFPLASCVLGSSQPSPSRS